MKNPAWLVPKIKDDVSSPLNAQIFEFCAPEFFQETLQNSEVASSSNCCYEENSPYTTNLSLPPDIEKFNNNCQDNNTNGNATPTATTTTTTTTTASTATTAAANANNISNIINTNNNNGLSIIFDSQDDLDHEISASIDFSSAPTFSVPQFITTQHEQFDFASVQSQLSLSEMVSADGLTQYPADSVVPLMAPPLNSVFEEDCLSSVPSYLPLNPSSPSCTFFSPYMSAAGTMTAALSVDSSGIFAGGILLGSELQPQEMEFQGDNGGIFCPDSIPRVFNPGDLFSLPPS